MSTIKYDQFKLLAIFAVVVEQKSFAAAARKLSSSRSRISEQVAKLEELLGVRLLQRTTRQLNLTDEGELVYQQALKLPDILLDLETSLSAETPSGRVVLTVNHDIAHKFLLPKLKQFRHQYPKIMLDLKLDDEAQDLVMEHIDLAIRIGKPKDSSLIARPLHQDAFFLFVSEEFVNQYGLPKQVTELVQLPWLTLSQMTEANTIKLLKNDELIEIKPEQMLVCNSPFMVQKMVCEGLGVAMLLPSTVKAEIEQGTLIQILPDITSEPLVFSLMYPSRRQLPQRTKAVIDFILEKRLFEDEASAQTKQGSSA